MDGKHEHFPISNRALGACPGDRGQHLNDSFESVVVYDHFNQDFAKEIGFVFMTAKGWALASLPSIATRVANSHAFHANILQGAAHHIQFHGLNDGHQELHGTSTHWVIDMGSALAIANQRRTNFNRLRRLLVHERLA